jgi:hypothetical protein
MKKTDLVKHLGKKIKGQMQQTAIPGRFAQGPTALPDRREQRKMDQAAGLQPFAVKLHIDLARQLRDVAEQQGVSLHALVDRLIRAGLGGVVSSSVAHRNAESTKAAAVKKAPVKEPAVEKAVSAKAIEEKVKVPAKKVPAKKAFAIEAPAHKAAAKKVAKKAAKTKA